MPAVGLGSRGEDPIYQELARRAGDAYPSTRVPLTSHLFVTILTEGSRGLASQMGISVRTLHRVLADDGLSLVQLRTWARCQVIGMSLQRSRSQREIVRLSGFRTSRTLQAFIRRELRTTTRELKQRCRLSLLAGKIAS